MALKIKPKPKSPSTTAIKPKSLSTIAVKPKPMVKGPRAPDPFRTPPDTLSHYTTLAGMQGIIGEGNMWMSNVSFLNDRRELKHGVNEAAKVIKQLELDAAHPEWDKALTAVVSDFRLSKIPNTYSACFCENEDVLSQWRGYAGSEQGIEIVFDRKKLVGKMKAKKADFYAVAYGNIRANKEIAERLFEALGEDPAGQRRLTLVERKEYAASLLSQMLPRFKHYGFREEYEWRFVIQQTTVRSGVVKFRPKGHYMVPYIIVPIGKAPDDHCVERMRIGPGKEQALTKRSVELFLESLEIDDIEVELSEVPFRV